MQQLCRFWNEQDPFVETQAEAREAGLEHAGVTQANVERDMQSDARRETHGDTPANMDRDTQGVAPYLGREIDEGAKSVEPVSIFYE